jgi:4-hydroxybenzoate polyprenyltransferase
MSDRQDDQRIGINSSALFFGKYAPTAIAVFLIGTVILLAGVGLLVNLNTAFWISLILASMGWIWQIIRLQQPEIPHPAYGEMFRQNVWIGFLMLAGMILGSL